MADEPVFWLAWLYGIPGLGSQGHPCWQLFADGRARSGCGNAPAPGRCCLWAELSPLWGNSSLSPAGNGTHTQLRRQSHFSRCPEEYEHYCVKGRCRFLVAEQAPACV